MLKLGGGHSQQQGLTSMAWYHISVFSDGPADFKAQVIASVTQVLAEAAVMTEQKPDMLDTTEGSFHILEDGSPGPRS